MTRKQDEKDEERRVAPFGETLLKLQRGKTHRELSKLLQDVTEAVVATHKPGTLTLTLKVAKSKASGMVEVVDTVTVKMPQAERSVSMFYVDDDSNLVRDDPRQGELPLGPVRVADDAEVERLVGQ